MCFGEILRKRRKELGYSMVKLAHMTFISASHINNIECGHRGASEGTKVALCKALKLEFRQVGEESEAMEDED